jgi:mono/diheme cytochrome c family protein
MRAFGLVAALLPIMIAAAHAQVGQRGADAQRGGELADRVCEPCHDVGKQPQVPSSLTGYGPSFSVIANSPNTTAQSLQSFLSRRHPLSRMSLPDLTAAQRADLAAYILSLRGRH